MQSACIWRPRPVGIETIYTRPGPDDTLLRASPGDGSEPCQASDGVASGVSGYGDCAMSATKHGTIPLGLWCRQVLESAHDKPCWLGASRWALFDGAHEDRRFSLAAMGMNPMSTSLVAWPTKRALRTAVLNWNCIGLPPEISDLRTRASAKEIAR